MREAVKSDYPFVTETSRHLVDAGGKRFRPLLVLLAAQFGDPGAPGVVPAAVVVELTHLATLYHDDVMDEAAVRRGAESANARWTNTVAILTGDFLFARASDVLADLGPEAVRIQARTFDRLVQGQIRETVGPDPMSTRSSTTCASCPTRPGSLIGTSCRFGAMLAGADESAVEMLARYGERIGVAFQLSDDLIDVAGEADVSGKTPGTDLREGVRTLPVLLALRAGTSSRLGELITAGVSDDAGLAEALQAAARAPGHGRGARHPSAVRRRCPRGAGPAAGCGCEGGVGLALRHGRSPPARRGCSPPRPGGFFFLSLNPGDPFPAWFPVLGRPRGRAPSSSRPARRQTALPPEPPTRTGYASTPPPTQHASTGPSRTWLVAVAGGVAVVIAIVVGFVVLAHKDKHNELAPVLRPIQQAAGVQLESDLRSAATAEDGYFAEHDAYTSDLATAGFRSNGSAQVVVVSTTSTAYCLKATSATASAPEYYSKAGGVSTTPCT